MISYELFVGDFDGFVNCRIFCAYLLAATARCLLSTACFKLEWQISFRTRTFLSCVLRSRLQCAVSCHLIMLRRFTISTVTYSSLIVSGGGSSQNCSLAAGNFSKRSSE